MCFPARSKTVPQVGETANDFFGPTAEIGVHRIPLLNERAMRFHDAQAPEWFSNVKHSRKERLETIRVRGESAGRQCLRHLLQLKGCGARAEATPPGSSHCD